MNGRAAALASLLSSRQLRAASERRAFEVGEVVAAEDGSADVREAGSGSLLRDVGDAGTGGARTPTVGQQVLITRILGTPGSSQRFGRSCWQTGPETLVSHPS